MSDDPETPFDSIEGAHEYVRMLGEAIEEARRSIQGNVAVAIQAHGAERRLEALRLVEYKLDQLQEHIGVSRRILNDLRTLRRLLLSERDLENGRAKPTSE
jgi:hypothetical protein